MLEALRDFPPDPSTANPLSLAVQSGLPQAIVLDTDAALVSAAAGDPRHLAVLRALGPVRGQVFPLAPAGAVLGLIVLAARNPVDPLRYAVMMDFARRVAETVGRLVLRAPRKNLPGSQCRSIEFRRPGSGTSRSPVDNALVADPTLRRRCRHLPCEGAGGWSADRDVFRR